MSPLRDELIAQTFQHLLRGHPPPPGLDPEIVNLVRALLRIQGEYELAIVSENADGDDDDDDEVERERERMDEEKRREEEKQRKRRQNTEAARRSRAKKVRELKGLREELQGLRKGKEEEDGE